MKLVEHHHVPGHSCGVDVVKAWRLSIGAAEHPAQYLVVGSNDNVATSEERVVRLFASLERDSPGTRHEVPSRLVDTLCQRAQWQRVDQPAGADAVTVQEKRSQHRQGLAGASRRTQNHASTVP